jgi:hypothetical protein
VRSGLTCILAQELTREGIWEALQARRTYATTGERMYLTVRSRGHDMGEEFTTTEPPELEVAVRGTKPLHSVEVVRGKQPVYQHKLFKKGGYLPDRLRLAWSGARITSRDRHTNWDGKLHIDRGSFRDVQEFAFDNRRQGVTGFLPTEIGWHSYTSGDVDGLLVDVNATADSRLKFTSGPCTFEFTLGEVQQGPIVEEAGGVNQRVEVSLAPAGPGPQSVEFSFVDEEAEPGLNRYYVRVMQEDGEQAWTSPMYIHYEPR